MVFGVCLPEGAVIEQDYELNAGSSDTNIGKTSHFLVVDTLEEVWDDNSLTRVYIDGR